MSWLRRAALSNAVEGQARLLGPCTCGQDVHEEWCGRVQRLLAKARECGVTEDRMFTP